MISTRGRYAIRVLLDLAEHRGEACTIQYLPPRAVLPDASHVAEIL